MPHEFDYEMMSPLELTWLLHGGVVSQNLSFQESRPLLLIWLLLPLAQDITT
jgi:hypothetical protein